MKKSLFIFAILFLTLVAGLNIVVCLGSFFSMLHNFGLMQLHRVGFNLFDSICFFAISSCGLLTTTLYLKQLNIQAL